MATTKYSPGDKVWLMGDNQPQRATIIRIVIYKDDIVYVFNQWNNQSEDEIAATKEELRDKIFSK